MKSEYEHDGMGKKRDPRCDQLSHSISQLSNQFLYVGSNDFLILRIFKTTQSGLLWMQKICFFFLMNFNDSNRYPSEWFLILLYKYPFRNQYSIPLTQYDTTNALSAVINPKTRKDLFYSYVNATPENATILQQLIDQRNCYDQLCGNSNFMQMQMNNTLMINPREARDFCENVLHSFYDHENELLKEIQMEKDSHLGFHEPVHYWDYFVYKGSLNARKQTISYTVIFKPSADS